MKYGTQFSGTDSGKRASGIVHNAARRSHANLFALATDGGTAEALQVAVIGPGNMIKEIVIETDANLSGITFQVGTVEDPDKYGTAVAGPNATAQRRYPPLSLGLNASEGQEYIILTPSAALPAVGTIRTDIVTSHR